MPPSMDYLPIAKFPLPSLVSNPLKVRRVTFGGVNFCSHVERWIRALSSSNVLLPDCTRFPSFPRVNTSQEIRSFLLAPKTKNHDLPIQASVGRVEAFKKDLLGRQRATCSLFLCLASFSLLPGRTPKLRAINTCHPLPSLRLWRLQRKGLASLFFRRSAWLWPTQWGSASACAVRRSATVPNQGAARL